jgi:hypothetical protein
MTLEQFIIGIVCLLVGFAAGFFCGRALTMYLIRLAARDLGKHYELKRRTWM